MHLDLAFDYAAAGLFAEALALLSGVVSSPSSATYPMVYYFLSQLAAQTGSRELAAEYRTLAAKASPDYCFPSRLEEMKLLEKTLDRPDAKGLYYLGNLYYDKKRYEEAISLWEKSVAIDKGFSIPWRNLGIAYFNIRHNSERALDAYQRALLENPQDARVFYELDQLRKRIGVPPMERLAFLQQRADLVAQRDDLTVELVTLYNQTGEPEKALEILLGRRFHPWEGGEGLVSGQYVWARRLLGISCLNNRRLRRGLGTLQRCESVSSKPWRRKASPDPGIRSRLFFRGSPARTAERRNGSKLIHVRGRERARIRRGWAITRLWPCAAWEGLRRRASFLQEMKEQLKAERKIEPVIDYFATSLPNFLVFEDDLTFRKDIECTFTEALVDLGLGNDLDAAKNLQRVVDKDPNHLAAQTMLAQISRSGDSVIESTSWLAK